MDRERFDPDLVDWDDPFEWDDGNAFHLFAHGPYGAGDAYDVLANYAALIPANTARGDADYFLVGQPPGEPPLSVPLAAPDSGDVRKVRPIGIYPASGQVLDQYLAGQEETPT